MSNKPIKRRRGARTICDLILWHESLDDIGERGYKILSDASWIAYQFIETRNKLKRNLTHYLDAAVVLVGLQDKVVTETEWEDELRRLWNTEGWIGAIDTIFVALFGRKPDRSSDTTIRQEAETVWTRVSVPYTEEQFAFLVKAQEYEWRRGWQNFTPTEYHIYCRQPLSFHQVPWEQAPISDPEQVSHPDQARIDNDFATIMKDFEL